MCLLLNINDSGCLAMCCSEEIFTTSLSYASEDCPSGFVEELRPRYFETCVMSMPCCIVALLHVWGGGGILGTFTSLSGSSV